MTDDYLLSEQDVRAIIALAEHHEHDAGELGIGARRVLTALGQRHYVALRPRTPEEIRARDEARRFAPAAD